MATERSREDIIELIRKCLALTKSDKPGEAANAAAKVQELLFKYHLEMAEVEAGEPGETSPVGEDLFDTTPKAHEGKWRSKLIYVIARHSFCRVIYGWKGRVYIIGTKTDVEATKEIYQWVAEQLIEMEPKYWATSRDIFDRRPTFKRSFFEGAVGEVSHRLYKQWEALRTETTQSTALVVQTDKLLKDYIEERWPHLGKARYSASYGSSAGIRAGREAGSQVNLGRPAKRLPGRGLID